MTREPRSEATKQAGGDELAALFATKPVLEAADLWPTRAGILREAWAAGRRLLALLVLVPGACGLAGLVLPFLGVMAAATPGGGAGAGFMGLGFVGLGLAQRLFGSDACRPHGGPERDI
jgi:hypothetical protein